MDGIGDASELRTRGRFERGYDTVTKTASGLPTWAKILIGVVVVVIFVGLLILAGWGLYKLFKSSSSPSTKLRTPIGELNIVSGPYGDYNALNPTYTGIYDADLVKDTYDRLYGILGYRAVEHTVGNVNEVTADTASDVVWDNRSRLLKIYDIEQRNGNGGTGDKLGFTVYVPGQSEDLRGTTIAYELVMRGWEVPVDTTPPPFNSKPKYDLIVLGRVTSVTTPVGQSVEISESTSSTVNKLLA